MKAEGRRGSPGGKSERIRVAEWERERENSERMRDRERERERENSERMRDRERE